MKRRATSSIVLPLAPWQLAISQAIDDLPPDIAAVVGWRLTPAGKMHINLAVPLVDEHRDPTDECELLDVAAIRFEAARGRLLFDSPWFGRRAYQVGRGVLRDVARDIQFAILELLAKATDGHAEPAIVKRRGVYLRPDGRCVLPWQERQAARLGGYRDEDDDRRDDDEEWEEGGDEDGRD